MTQLKVGVFGAGMIAQIEHLPNLLHLKEKFTVSRVADPSAMARDFVEQRFGLATCTTLEDLLGEKLDVLLVAAPDFAHYGAIRRGLEAGLHVFTEKPLCYGRNQADALITARDRAQRVCQVGYMKRFDPSYEAALEALPADPAKLRFISVEVNEPEAEYQMAQHPYRRSEDVPAEMIAAGREETRLQVRGALGAEVDDLTFRGFVGAYSSSLVHDVNAVHGIMERLGIADLTPTNAEIFAGGEGGAATVRFNQGRSLWQMMHLMVPKLADYRERIGLYFDDQVIELIFPSPYLDHQQTELIIQRSSGHRYERVLQRNGYQESYIRELEGFWASVVEGAPVRNTLEQAKRDMSLLCDFARMAGRVR